MNSQGWIRGLMAANYDTEKFLLHVADCISREFEREVVVKKLSNDNYMIRMGEYSLNINKEEIEKHKGSIGPYRLDKYILNNFREQGFEFDKKRSQYIYYVYLSENK